MIGSLTDDSVPVLKKKVLTVRYFVLNKLVQTGVLLSCGKFKNRLFYGVIYHLSTIF
jgi:hypothetical protein